MDRCTVGAWRAVPLLVLADSTENKSGYPEPTS